MDKNFQILASPLNYTGGKAKLLPQLLPLFPKEIKTFVDLFCGGCNVGINITAERYLYNDILEPLIGLYKTFLENSEEVLVQDFEQIISQYSLLKSDKNSYLCLRNDFNSLKQKDLRYYEMFYMLIVFSFNNQIRFNRYGHFNMPTGKRDFNPNIRRKLSAFLKVLKEQNPTFTDMPFNQFNTSNLTADSFVYCDPPYRISTAAYTEQNQWTEQDDILLFSFLDNLNENKIKFALSNILFHRGQENLLLRRWIENRPYKVYHLKQNYDNCNYQIKNKQGVSDEVLIANY